MNSHMLMSLTDFRDSPYTRPVHIVEIRLIEANVAAGNACMWCSCGQVLLALEHKMITGPNGVHAKHLADVVKARRA